jgi:hypothetical protein
MSITGKLLAQKWNVNSKHSLYKKEGNWYHIIEDFPGAYFDDNGYVIFDSKSEYDNNPYLQIGETVHVKNGISKMPNYIRVIEKGVKYWWVNQGRTWEHEYNGGFLWAPYKNSAGRPCWHWDTMDELQKGDYVFSYVRGQIVSVSKVKGPTYKSQKPKEFSDWSRDGRRCDVVYKIANTPIVIMDHLDTIKSFLPTEHSPLQKNGLANQIYLVQLNEELGEYLINFFDERTLFYDNAQIGQTEDVEQVILKDDGESKRRTITVVVTRVVRDTQLSKDIKRKYDYSCQICGLVIKTNTKSGKYAEAAHIKPLEKDGDDKENNIICLCPNHHTMLDYGSISINDDYTLLGADGELHTNHRINKDNLKYHRDNIYSKNEPH